MRQGELVSPFPSTSGRLPDGSDGAGRTIRPSESDWEQRYRRTVITTDTLATALVVGVIGEFFGVRDAANWHEKWGFSPSAPSYSCWALSR